MSTAHDAAVSFLRQLPAPATPQMTAAVEAWATYENGPGPITGNNAWNLHIGPTCPQTAHDGVGGLNPSQKIAGANGLIGNRYVGEGDQNVGIFDTLDNGVRAAIANLLYWGPTEGYDKIIARAKAGDPIGFLSALAASGWSAGRYGTLNGGANQLLPVYTRLIGASPVPVTIAGAKFVNCAGYLIRGLTPLVVDAPAGTELYRWDGTAYEPLPMAATLDVYGLVDDTSGRYAVLIDTPGFYAADHVQRPTLLMAVIPSARPHARQ